MTRHPHDIWLGWASERYRCHEDSNFLCLAPVGALFLEKTTDSVRITVIPSS